MTTGLTSIKIYVKTTSTFADSVSAFTAERPAYCEYRIEESYGVVRKTPATSCTIQYDSVNG